MDLGREVFNARITSWPELQDLTRRVRGDAAGNMQPVAENEIARMLDVVDQVKQPPGGERVRHVTLRLFGNCGWRRCGWRWPATGPVTRVRTWMYRPRLT